MCGQCGIIYGSGSGSVERTQKELRELSDLFTKLLIANEPRGPFATGIAVIRADGFYATAKDAVCATTFANSARYLKILDNITRWNIESPKLPVTILMGHTRWPTQGSILDNGNNHPIVVGEKRHRIIGTHNGHIQNAAEMFREFGFPRKHVTDSEIIFAMAEASLSYSGSIQLSAFGKLLGNLVGQMSAVMVATTKPERIIVLKCDKPLEIMYSESRNAVVYASTLGEVTRVMTRAYDWRRLNVTPNSLVTFNCGDLLNTKNK